MSKTRFTMLLKRPSRWQYLSAIAFLAYSYWVVFYFVQGDRVGYLWAAGAAVWAAIFVGETRRQAEERAYEKHKRECPFCKEESDV